MGPSLRKTPAPLFFFDDFSKVSPLHAEIWPQQHGYSITDKGSTTGTFVNGRQLMADIPYLLASGDEIRIGQTTLTYEEAGSDARDDQLDLQEGLVPERKSFSVGSFKIGRKVCPKL